jgi:hypothetical protein
MGPHCLFASSTAPDLMPRYTVRIVERGKAVGFTVAGGFAYIKRPPPLVSPEIAISKLLPVVVAHDKARL